MDEDMFSASEDEESSDDLLVVLASGLRWSNLRKGGLNNLVEPERWQKIS